MMVVLSAPLSLLCFHLAWLCYRKDCPKPALVSLSFAIILLLITVGFVGVSMFAWDNLKDGLAVSWFFSGPSVVPVA